MRNASQAFKSGIGQNLLKMVVFSPSRDELATLTYNDLTSFNYAANGTSSDSMQLGYASISTISFTLYNTDRRWDNFQFGGTTIDLFIGKRIQDVDEFVKIGTFAVDKSPKKGSIISVTASDNMRLFDVRFKGISFPCTLKELIMRLCAQAGVTLSTQGFTNFSFQVDTLEKVTEKSCREILSYACELAGGFAIINSEGELELRWFDTSVINEEISESAIQDLSIDEVLTPTGLSVFFNEDEIVYGDIDAPLYFSDNNILLSNLSKDKVESFVEGVYNRSVQRLVYDVGEISANGSCLIEPGDVVSFLSQGKRYKFIVAAIKLSGNLSMTISSTAPSSSSSYSSGTISPGSSGSGDSVKTAYLLSYDDATSSGESKELIVLPIIKSGNNVPLVMVTSTYDCDSVVSQRQYVKFDLLVGSQIHYVAFSRCLIGKNTFTFTWPLDGIPEGQSRIRVEASVFSGEEGIDPPTVYWEQGQTSIFLFGRGFTSTTSQWNGFVFLADTTHPVNIVNFKGKDMRLSGVRSVINGIPEPYADYQVDSIVLDELQIKPFASKPVTLQSLRADLII